MSRTATGGLLLAALALALAAPIPGAQAATTLVVGKASATADNETPVNVGDQLGFFKKHGLDLKIVDFAGGSKMDQAMTAGGLDISVSAGIDMAYEAKGVPMVAVCEDTTTFPFLGIGVPYDSPIHDVAQLKGKKIGISSSGSLTDWLGRELETKKGWGPDGVTRVAIGNGAASIIAAFRGHLIDADIGETSLFVAMEENKTGRLLIPVTGFEGNAASGALFASDHLVKTDPAAIRAFLAGWIETIDFMLTHKAETVKIESGLTGRPESVMSKEYDLTIGMFSQTCKFDAPSLATLKRSFMELKLLPKAPDMAKLYTDAYLPK